VAAVSGHALAEATANPHHGAPGSYARRRPEKTVLYDIVREHKETLFAEARARSESGRGYPKFIAEEFAKYMRCGILAYGLVRVYCPSCKKSDVVGFSCKGRGICPSCCGRRMSDMTAHLVDRVMPKARYRQWTLSFPFQVRVLLVRHPELLSELLGIFLRQIFAWQRHRAKQQGLIARGEKPEVGSVAFIQKFGSRLNVHVHIYRLITSFEILLQRPKPPHRRSVLLR